MLFSFSLPDADNHVNYNKVIEKDKETDRSRGYGFVTMSNPQEADAVINGLNGQE